MYHFLAYGLIIRTPLLLPELFSVKEVSDNQVDVTIHMDNKVDNKINFSSEKNKRFIRSTPEGINLFWADIGSFMIRNGCEIVIDPCPTVKESTLRLFILGTTLAMLLHQRREVTVLHASTVAISNQALAFVGFKGAGKSTMAATFHAHGYGLLTDDILAIDSKQDQLLALPGFPYLKLWPDSLSAIGYSPESLPQLRPELEKRGYRLQSGFTQVATPLRAIFVLSRGKKLAINTLHLREALAALMPHWYGARFGMDVLQNLGLSNHFLQCAEIVRKVPVYILQRPDNLSTLPDVVRLIEAHLNLESA